MPLCLSKLACVVSAPEQFFCQSALGPLHKDAMRSCMNDSSSSSKDAALFRLFFLIAVCVVSSNGENIGDLE